MDNFDLDLNIDLFGNDQKAEVKNITPVKNNGRSVCFERKVKDTYRRAYGETQLLDITPELKEGYSYNFMTNGDVDALSYLRLILRSYDLDYLLFSTWCMGKEDCYQINDFIQQGKIKKVDAYLGEIFKSSYIKEHEYLKKVINGRLVTFKNHSKIFAGYNKEKHFYFSCQMSCNINTNPRAENGCITVSKESFEFYFNFFEGING